MHLYPSPGLQKTPNYLESLIPLVLRYPEEHVSDIHKIEFSFPSLKVLCPFWEGGLPFQDRRESAIVHDGAPCSAQKNHTLTPARPLSVSILFGIVSSTMSQVLFLPLIAFRFSREILQT